MNEWFREYRELILFAWGIASLTTIIFFHIVTQDAAYIILAAAIGLPIALGVVKK